MTSSDKDAPREFVLDFFGNEVRVDDTVALIENNYRNLQFATVTKIHAHKITLTINVKKPGAVATTQRYPSEVIKRIRL